MFEILQVYKSNPFQSAAAPPRSWTIFEKYKMRPEISAEAHQWEQTSVQIPAVVSPSLVYVPPELQTLLKRMLFFSDVSSYSSEKLLQF